VPALPAASDAWDDHAEQHPEADRGQRDPDYEEEVGRGKVAEHRVAEENDTGPAPA
jgi:hypothetical protein